MTASSFTIFKRPISAAAIGQAIRASRFPDFWLFLLAGTVGWIAGLVVTAMSRATQLLHTLLFQVPAGERLSSQDALASPWMALVPVAGGIAVVLIGLAFRPGIRRPAVDPIEANALHGGQMSFFESLLVSLQTMASSGFGASVGLEAGYTQAAAVVGSKLAMALNLRRNDVRTLVGCAAAGAISAAFDAPLAGAFYAFETILGVYNVGVVAPVLAAALTASFAARVMGAVQMPLLIGTLRPLTSLADMVPYLFLGALAAAAAIGVMRLVIICERAFNMLRCPAWLRPAVGGAIVGAMALITPHILSSGHGALHADIDASETWQVLFFLFALKALASSVSLGSGFRGGLFFASLYLGLLFGKGVAVALAAAHLMGNLSPELMAVVGMASMAVGIVGGPMTMTFLIMESTGDLAATGAVLAASIVTSLVVRSTFGYSFSTWRLHLRGQSIKGAHDVGRIRGLTVARMMREDPQTFPASSTLAEFRARFPLGSGQRVVALDGEGRYAGLLLVTDAYAPGMDETQTSLARLIKHKDHALLPSMSANEAAKVFEASNSEELVVLQDAWSRKVAGLLTEQHLLRRYAEELDKTHQDLTGLGA
ncbi:MAG: chloride channel protein [Alphaproteobacteria bacterium]|nr:chloride channel protein [Alphaproteobacteria bacterium]